MAGPSARNSNLPNDSHFPCRFGGLSYQNQNIDNMGLLSLLFGARLNITCQKCGKKYNIGKDAVVITSDDWRNYASRTLGANDSDDRSQEDLVSGIESAKPEVRESILAEAQEKAKEICRGLSQGQKRTWRCHACKTVNSYPRSVDDEKPNAIPSHDSTTAADFYDTVWYVELLEAESAPPYSYFCLRRDGFVGVSSKTSKFDYGAKARSWKLDRGFLLIIWSNGCEKYSIDTATSKVLNGEHTSQDHAGKWRVRLTKVGLLGGPCSF